MGDPLFSERRHRDQRYRDGGELRRERILSNTEDHDGRRQHGRGLDLHGAGAGNTGGSRSRSTGGGDGIKKGDKVKVIRTMEQSGKTKGYQYAGGTFVCWYDVYDVIQVKGTGS